jgi:4-hydroxyphenylpyruvate dioxygenase-like putative hemolysin
VLTTPLHHDNPLHQFLTLHGDSVKDIAFEVDDLDEMFEETRKRGAQAGQPPFDETDTHGWVRRSSICTYGDTLHSFIIKKDFAGPFLPGFEARDLAGQTANLLRVDHVVGNVEDGQMNRWCATRRFARKSNRPSGLKRLHDTSRPRSSRLMESPARSAARSSKLPSAKSSMADPSKTWRLWPTPKC